MYSASTFTSYAPVAGPPKLKVNQAEAHTTFVLFVVESEIHLTGNFSYGANHFHHEMIQEAVEFLQKRTPAVILVFANQEGKTFGKYIHTLRNLAHNKSIPFVLYSPNYDLLARNIAIKFGFDDYYFGDLYKGFQRKIKFFWRIQSLKKNQSGNRRFLNGHHALSRFRWLVVKRTLDILLAGSLLLLLLPAFLIIAVIIKFESRGPVFYTAKRAGNGYRVFDFYKFRSMYNGADRELHKLAQQNQYGNSAFFKIIDDPRVTPFGSFLRNTSLDELPQLLNVLKGDMSLVGNRPLPLYEAEKLTKDGTASRFLAPAGITGLWQITKRGKHEMSEEERIRLDQIYARKHSFILDMKILVGTLPALMQKEKV